MWNCICLIKVRMLVVMRLVGMRRIVCESVLRILSLVKQQVCEVLSAEMKLRILVCSS